MAEWVSGLPHIHGSPRLGPDPPLICASCGFLARPVLVVLQFPNLSIFHDTEAADHPAAGSWPL